MLGALLGANICGVPPQTVYGEASAVVAGAAHVVLTVTAIHT